MSLIPMYFSQAGHAIKQAHSSGSLQFAPSSATVLLSQPNTVTNACADSNGLNVSYFADYLEVHCDMWFQLPA